MLIRKIIWKGDQVLDNLSLDLVNDRTDCAYSTIFLPARLALMPEDMVEQSTIASALNSMDSETSAFESKKEKCESMKQGMMQQLLTSKFRLV